MKSDFSFIGEVWGLVCHCIKKKSIVFLIMLPDAFIWLNYVSDYIEKHDNCPTWASYPLLAWNLDFFF
jgi:hypothetical protein